LLLPKGRFRLDQEALGRMLHQFHALSAPKTAIAARGFIEAVGVGESILSPDQETKAVLYRRNQHGCVAKYRAKSSTS
jgi:hypothetical protein